MQMFPFFIIFMFSHLLTKNKIESRNVLLRLPYFFKIVCIDPIALHKRDSLPHILRQSNKPYKAVDGSFRRICLSSAVLYHRFAEYLSNPRLYQYISLYNRIHHLSTIISKNVDKLENVLLKMLF